MKPIWISIDEVCETYRISKATAWRWEKQFNLHFTKVLGKKFYDLNNINAVLTNNSTYQFTKS